MKRMSVALLVIMAVAATGCSGGKLSRKTLDQLQTKPLPAFTPPKVREVGLASGARLFLLEDHELPIVNVSVMARAGTVYEPGDEIGLATLTAMLLEDGGTRSMSPDQVDILIDDTAARMSFDAGKESITASLKVLSEELPKTLPLFMDLLLRPGYAADRLQVNRMKFIDQLKRDEDDPETVAERDFGMLVYGDTSPWARWPTPDGVRTITLDAVRSYGARFVRPNNLLIAAAGDFKADDFIAAIEKLLAGVTNEKVELPAVPPVVKEFTPGEEFVRRDLNQAFIYLGHLGIKRHNPDKYALQVMNTVLGGGSFKSRLTEDIRVSKGLAYSVWSHFGWGTDYGLFRIYAATKADNADEVIKLIRAQVDELAQTGEVSEEEFRFAKDVVLNGLIFEFENPFKIAYSQALYHFYGYPPDYWTIYRDSIKRVTRADIKRVAHEYLHPHALKTLVVGPKAPEKLQ